MNFAFGRAALIVFFLSFYACLEGFLLLRAILRARGVKKGGNVFLALYWAAALAGAVLYYNSRLSSGGMRSFFSLASSYWGLLLFVPSFLLADILTLGAFLFRTGKRRRTAFSGAAFGITVRAASLLFSLVILAAGSFSARFAKVTSYTITLEKPLPKNGLRVALVSDIHIGAMMHKKQLARLVTKINSMEADIVLIAGDIIDRNMNVYKSENLNEELGAIKARLGVFASPGNHDYFGGDLGELEEQLSAAGIKLLNDETILVDNAFYVAGRNDASSSRRGVTRAALKELTGNLDVSLPLIVMDHQPLNLGEAEAAGADLQVSGHTHRGQVWPVSLIVKRMYENSYGLLFRGKTAFVVSSGAGTWGPPFRIGTRSEIVRVELQNPSGPDSVTRH